MSLKKMLWPWLGVFRGWRSVVREEEICTDNTARIEALLSDIGVWQNEVLTHAAHQVVYLYLINTRGVLWERKAQVRRIRVYAGSDGVAWTQYQRQILRLAMTKATGRMVHDAGVLQDNGATELDSGPDANAAYELEYLIQLRRGKISTGGGSAVGAVWGNARVESVVYRYRWPEDGSSTDPFDTVDALKEEWPGVGAVLEARCLGEWREI